MCLYQLDTLAGGSVVAALWATALGPLAECTQRPKQYWIARYMRRRNWYLSPEW